MRKKDITTIWKRPKFLPYVQPDLTDEILSDAEEEIGHKLPNEYIELLKIQNGGYIRFELSEIPHQIIRGIGPYFPSITDWDWVDYEDYQDELNFKLEGLLPFDGDGHWFICFDYRKKTDEPVITYIDLEYNEERIIANSFKEYLDMLELEPQDYVIVTQLSVKEVLNQIAEILEIEFGEPEYYSFGYALYSSMVKSGKIWVSPNTVPSGYVPENNPRYEELKSGAENTSLRYPEINENYLFIGVSDDQLRDEIFKDLKNGSLIIESISKYLQ